MLSGAHINDVHSKYERVIEEYEAKESQRLISSESERVSVAPECVTVPENISIPEPAAPPAGAALPGAGPSPDEAPAPVDKDKASKIAPLDENKEALLIKLREHLDALEEKRRGFLVCARQAGKEEIALKFKKAAEAAERIHSFFCARTEEYSRNSISLKAYKAAVEKEIHPDNADVITLLEHRGCKELLLNVVICLCLPIVGWVVGLVSLATKNTFFKCATNSEKMLGHIHQSVLEIKEVAEEHEEEKAAAAVHVMS